jgi:hypothetical protein
VSKFDSGVSKLLGGLALDGFADEFEGSTEQMGWYGLLKGPIEPHYIDDHNERERDDGYRQQFVMAQDVFTLMSSAGSIVKQWGDGSVTSQVFSTKAELDAAWQEVIDTYTIERCEECEAEAEEHGKGNPIVHLDDCEIGLEEAA